MATSGRLTIAPVQPLASYRVTPPTSLISINTSTIATVTSPSADFYSTPCSKPVQSISSGTLTQISPARTRKITLIDRRKSVADRSNITNFPSPPTDPPHPEIAPSHPVNTLAPLDSTIPLPAPTLHRPLPINTVPSSHTVSNTIPINIVSSSAHTVSDPLRVHDTSSCSVHRKLNKHRDRRSAFSLFSEGPPRSAPPISSPIEALAAAAVAAAAAATPKSPTAAEVKSQQQPSTSRQIPPNLNLSNPATPTTPNPALRSPRPPIKSAHFDALEAEGERDTMVRTLVLQLQREMQDEIDRLTSVHRKALEEKSAEFQALAELLSKKREDWSLQMAAKMTLIADQQHDIVGFIKQANESAIRIKSLEEELAKEKAVNERLRAQLGDSTLPSSSKTFVKPKDPPVEEELMLVSSNKDSDGFEKPSTNARKAVKRPATDN